MTDLPFDPVKALDLNASFRPPDSARQKHTYLPVPARAFSRELMFAVVFVDGFGQGHGFRLNQVSETEWLKFLAQCMLRGLDQPCAVTHKDCSFVRCRELYRDGYVTIVDHEKAADYRAALDAARSDRRLSRRA